MKSFSLALVAAMTWSGVLALAAEPLHPAFEEVLPSRTCECVFVSDLGQWTDLRFKTFGTWVDNSLIQHTIRNLEPRWGQIRDLPAAVGQNWESMRAACSGRAAWAIVVPPNDNRLVWVLMFDTQGKAAGRDRLRESLATATRGAGGNVNTSPYREDGKQLPLTTYSVENRPPSYQLEIDDTWILTNDREVLNGIVGRWNTPAADSLMNYPSWQFIADQTKTPKSERADVRWFVRPFIRAQAARVLMPWPKKMGQDPLKVLQPEGFDAILACGGCATFGTGDRILTSRLAIHAPKPPGGYINSMRMCQFENGPTLAPEPWVPATAQAYFTVRWNVPNGYQTYGTMFDRLVEEDRGTFTSIIKSLKSDPDGPNVDVEHDIIATLDHRVSVATMTDDTTKSSMVLAVPTHDEKRLAQALKACFVNDRQCVKHTFQNHDLWALNLKNPKKADSLVARSRVFAAANGHLWVAAQTAHLETALRKATSPSLQQAPEYQQVMNDLKTLVPGATSGQLFGRMTPGHNAPKSSLEPTEGIVYQIFPGSVSPTPAPRSSWPRELKSAVYGYTMESLPDGLKIAGVLRHASSK